MCFARVWHGWCDDDDDDARARARCAGWFGDFELLERHHGYIQWLFPIRENGMNMVAQRWFLFFVCVLCVTVDARPLAARTRVATARSRSDSQRRQVSRARRQVVPTDVALLRHGACQQRNGRGCLWACVCRLLFFCFFFLRVCREFRVAPFVQIGRAAHYAPRYRHLDSSFHNYLRITRILKCLGELGFEHYKWPFLRVGFFLFVAAA